MSFSKHDSLVRQMDAAIFNEFGGQALYNGVYAVEITIDQDVERMNSYGESIVNSYEITVHNHQVGDLERDDFFDVGNDRYTITEIVVSDESVTIGAAAYGSGQAT